MPRWDLLGFEEALDGHIFSRPIDMRPLPGGGLAVAERPGKILLHTDGESPRALLDLTDIIVQSGSEDGLLSISVHPEFEAFPFIYIYYTIDGKSRLSRFPVRDGRTVRDEELIILDIEQPTVSAHNGGTIQFGPDGMLYLGIGDGGDHDGWEQAQRLDTLLGKIIRIDVRGSSEERPYRIPKDNPLADVPGAMPEIYAWGFRNPWRMHFDALDGTLWTGDVGGKKLEEVNIVQRGANHGWGIFEGDECVKPEQRCVALLDAVMPVFTYPHGKEFGCAIIGGLVYRGSEIPWLNGAYLFGDYCNANIRALQGDAEAGWTIHTIPTGLRHLYSFALDGDGEVYLLSARGKPVMKLVELPEPHKPH